MNKNILRALLPGKWSLILFLVIFIMFFAWGTTFDKKDGSVSVDSIFTKITYSIPVPWNPDQRNLATLLVGEVIPVLGPFNLIVNFAGESLWWGAYYDEQYSFKDYTSVLMDFYCILISFEAGVLFSLSLLRRNVKKEDMLDSGSLVLYRSIIIIISVLIFHYL